MTKRLEHGTPEGYDAGCVNDEKCPAFTVHGMSCESAYYRFVSGERRYMQLRGRGLPSTEIAKRLGFSPDKAAARAAELAAEKARSNGENLAKARAVQAERRRVEKEAAMTAAVSVEADAARAETDLKEVAVVEKPKREAKVPAVPKVGKRKTVVPSKPVEPKSGPLQSEVRAWARANGVEVNQRGSVRADVLEAYRAAHESGTVPAAELLREKREQEGRPFHEVTDEETGDAIEPHRFHKSGVILAPSSGPSYEALATQLDVMSRYAAQMRRERDQARGSLAFVLERWGDEQRWRKLAEVRADAAERAPHVARFVVERPRRRSLFGRGGAAA